MLKNKKLTHKLFSVALLVAFTNLYIPAFAVDNLGLNQTVLNQVNGKYGANLNNVTGATVNSNGNFANITNEASKNSILEWNSLNTAPGQTLQYNMGANNYSLNKVVGTGISQFAGNLIAPEGRVIISNPSGIFFENGSYTNVNDLTLTTHQATMDSLGKLNLEESGFVNGQGVKIGGIGASANAAVMRLSNDLNIISNGIKIQNADVLAGNNVRLITTDGVNFIDSGILPESVAKININAATSTPVKFDATTNSGEKISSSILVKDSAIAVKNEDTGKIYFVTNEDSVNSNIAAIDSALDGKIALDVAGNATFEVIGNLDISGISQGKNTSKVGGNLIAKTLNKSLTLSNNKTFNGIIITTTLQDYIASNFGGQDKSFTKDSVKHFLEANANENSTIAQSVIDSVYDNLLNITWKTETPVNQISTNTKYSGKGIVNLANTTVLGNKVEVNGAGVRVYNLSARNADVNITSTDTRNATVLRNTDSTEYQTSKLIAQYDWTGNYSPIYTWNNDNGSSYIIGYNGDSLVWSFGESGQSGYWTSLSTNERVDLNLFIKHPVKKKWISPFRYEKYTDYSSVYYTAMLKGEEHDVDFRDGRWEVNDYKIGDMFGLSWGRKVTNATNLSYKNEMPSYTPSNAGINLGNYSSVDSGITKMVSGEVALSETIAPSFNAIETSNTFLHTPKAGNYKIQSILNAGEITIDNHDTINSPNIQKLGSLTANATNGINIYKLNITGDTNLFSDDKISISDLISTNDLKINPTTSMLNSVILKNLNVKGDVSIFSNKQVSVSNLNQNTSEYGNLDIRAWSGNASINNANTNNLTLIGAGGTKAVLSAINANGDVTVNGNDSVSSANLTGIVATGDIIAKANSYIIADTLTANNVSLASNYTTLKAENITANNGDVTTSSKGISTLTNVNASGSLIASTVNGDLTISDSSANNAEFNAPEKTLTVSHGSFTKIKAAAADIDFDTTNVGSESTNVGSESTIVATKDVTMNNSYVSNTTVNANNGTFSSIGTQSKTPYISSNSTVNAANVILKGVTVNGSSKINSSGNVTLAKSSSMRTYIKGNATINATEGTIKVSDTQLNGAILNAKTIELNSTDGSEITDSVMKATESINGKYKSFLNSSLVANTLSLEGAYLDTTIASANDGVAYINGANLKNKSSIVAQNIKGVDNSDIITNLNLDNSNITSTLGNLSFEGAKVKIFGNSSLNVTGNSSNILLDNIKAEGSVSTVGSVIVSATNKAIVSNSIFENLNVSGSSNLLITDSSMNSLTTTNTGNVNLLGINVANDISVSGANDLVISNSTSAPQKGISTIAELTENKTAITDYNDSKYTSTDFEKVATSLGNQYGEGSRISVVNGDLKVSDVNNVNIANSAILGDYNTTNVKGDSTLITSYVGGTYSPNRTSIGGDSNIYLSYIEPYTPYYMIPESGFNYSTDDINRLKYGNEVKFSINRNFVQKGFAANDDDIKVKISKTLSTVKQGKNSSIILGQPFIAE